jgi:hypothetical protein
VHTQSMPHRGSEGRLISRADTGAVGDACSSPDLIHVLRKSPSRGVGSGSADSGDFSERRETEHHDKIDCRIIMDHTGVSVGRIGDPSH